MKHTLRAQSLILAALMAASAMTACGGDTPAGTDTTASAGDPAADVTTDSAYPALEVRDLGGKDVNILIRSEWTYEFVVEEENGDLVNDTAYRRNRAVEERLNVKILATETGDNNALNALQPMILAQEDVYSMVMPHASEAPISMISQNMFIDVNTTKYIDTTKPYYNQSAAEAFRIGGADYIIAGKYPYTTFPSVYLIFNKLSTADDTNKYIINVDWFKFYNEGDSNPTALGNKVMYAQGCDVAGTKNQALFDEAVAMAADADYVILTLGTDLNVSDESHDRKNLNLPGAQQLLLEAVYKANPNTIAVLVTCSSLTINWAQENIPVIMSAWYDGQEQGQAISDVIFGKHNPGGKLTTTWYNSVSDLPSDLTNYDIRRAKYTYMYHDKTPLYPFGYGLSYTTYDYSNLSISKNTLNAGEEITVSADITNSGKVAGAEIVQLYAHVNSNLNRPIKQLVGFARVELAPGETKTVTMPLKHEQLAYYNDTNHTFDVEEGTVDILLGASSADIRLKGQINTGGATVKTTYKSNPTGIESALRNDKIEGERVYNIAGHCVGTAENFDSLPKGFYIIGGKKYIKRIR